MTKILFILLTTYTVNFWSNTDETKLLDTQQVVEHENAVQPNDPDSVCFKFTGWDGNFSDVQSDLNIHATYVQYKYILSIDSESGMSNGTIVAEDPYAFNESGMIMDIPCGTTVSVRAVPKDGYKLSEWYQNGVKLNTKATTIDIILDESTVQEGNIVIYAIFEEDSQTGVESQVRPASAISIQKMLRNGMLFIEQNGKIYNALGQPVVVK